MRYLITLLFAALSFNAVGQIQYDFPYNPDADNDAFVSSTDLLELLAIYGEAFSTDELYLSQDSTSLIVYVGDLDKIKCASACVNLDGNWSNLTSRDLIKHYDQLALYPAVHDSWPDKNYMWYMGYNNSGFEIPNTYPWELDSRCRNTTYNNDSVELPAFQLVGNTGYIVDNQLNEYECWCVTHQRPRVEYESFNLNDYTISEWNVQIDEMALGGWKILPQGSTSAFVNFWRWAE
jgi:hypothetical protein